MIRKFRHSDSSSCSELLFSLFKDQISPYFKENQIKPALSDFLKISRSYKFVAVQNKKIVGIALVEANQGEPYFGFFKITTRNLGIFVTLKLIFYFLALTIFSPRMLYEEAWIYLIGVDKNYQGKAIGLKLISYISKEMKSQGLEYLSVHVRLDNPAIKWYQKLGFKEVRRIRNILGEHSYERLKL